MVNTFVPCYPLEKAISLIDNRRLGKQRVEAQQILNALLNALAIARVYNLPLQPKGDSVEADIQREQWYRQTYQWYKQNVLQQKKCLYHLNEHYSTEALPRYKKVGVGFVFHPMTMMWIGHEDGLRYYINLCISEWVYRGYKNNMKFHLIFVQSENDTPPLPWWVQCPALHYSHCSALLRKERARKEPTWYWNIDEIQAIHNGKWYHKGYLWVNHLSIVDRQRLLNGEIREDDSQLCAPINNDFIED